MSEAAPASEQALPGRFLDREWLPTVLCILLIGPAVWWLTQVDYFSSHDGDLHRWRIWEFWQIWQYGQVPVRWSTDLGYGFGSPLFTYYNPLAYLLGGAMQGWGLDSADAAKLVFGASLGVMMVGMYVLADEWYRGQAAGRWAALVAATMCVYAPYMLANVYRRGAMAETLALGIAPWVLWTVLLSLRRRDLRSHLAVGLSVGMLILTHNLTAVAFAPVAGVMVLGWLVVKRIGWANGVQAVGKLLLAATLGLAISGFYLVPVVGQLSYVRIHHVEHSVAPSKYLERFIPATDPVQARPIHDYSLYFDRELRSVPRLGLVQAAVIVTGLVVGGVMAHRRRPMEIALAVGLAAAIFMVSPASQIIWDIALSKAPFVFPWRFLGIIAILGGLVAGRLAAFRVYGAPIALALIIAIVVAGMWVQVDPSKWQNYRGPASNAGEFERWTGLVGLTTYDEYLPTRVMRVSREWFDPIQSGDARSAAIAGAKLAEVGESHWQFEVATAEPTTITLDVFYFPSWRATIDGRPAETRAISELGLLGIDLPAGTHRVEVFQEATELERVGLVVSVLAVIALGGLWAWRSEGIRKDWVAIGMMAVVVVALLPMLLAVIRPRPQPEFRSAAQGMVQAGGLELLGARLDQGRLGSTGIVDVELFFISAGDPPDEAPVMKAHLAERDGRVVSGSSHVLGRGLRPARIWQPNMVVTDRFELELPFESDGGNYLLRVGFADGPMKEVGSFELVTAGARHVYIPAAAMLDEWKPVLWGERLLLERAEVGPETWGATDSEQGMSVGAAFVWQLVGGRSETFTAVVRLVDGQGEIYEETRDRIEFSPGETLVTSDTTIPLPAGLPPGRYRLELLVRDGAGDELPIFSDEDVANLAKSVQLWIHDVPHVCDCMSGNGTIVDVAMGDGLRMLGYEREVDGDSVDVNVYWQARYKIERQYTSFIHLLNRAGRRVDQHDVVAYQGGLPTTRWEIGRVVPFAAKLRLPEIGGPFRLRSGMYEFYSGKVLDTADGRGYVSLGLVERREPPEGPEVEFVGGVSLLGYRLERDGDQGLVTLYWQTSRRIENDYSVFVHVLDSGDNIVAQGDGPPEMGERTSAEWPLGEVIVDPHWFDLPAERPLRVRVGLYRLDDGSRLATASGDDKVDLGEVD